MPLPYTGKNGELNFEADLIEKLQEVGWNKKVLKNVTEKDLIENWKNILFENNKPKLNDVPLSDSEMNQIVDYIRVNCNTPVKANLFINGKNICIKRDSDSPDKINRNKEVYLDIFDPVEIAGGKTKYQIAEQIIFDTSASYNDRRGDLMLLINGIPLIHIELKASGIPVEQATNQIQKYAKEGVFKSIFSLIQVFFAITPEDAVYFANPGKHNDYNESFFFHWGDKNNNPITNWKLLCKGESSILSIPEAHQLIGYYTVPDKGRDILKVARSYQYHAIKAVLNRIKKQKWGENTPLGGYVWCTTGGGKTMTSFKAGQMIIDKCLADKVVFVVDRVELNNQSLEEYNSFSRDGEEVQETKSANDLFVKLKSTNGKDSLIVTSIQKLTRINEEEIKLRPADLNYIVNKRIVFIIDEAHRSQFGEMHEKMKNTFTNAVFVGFTGTPIFSENDKSGCTTETVFGNCLAVYSIANGIRDGNVLGFDPKAIKTYEDKDLKESIALEKCRASTIEEAKKDKDKFKIYKDFMSRSMTTSKDKKGKEIKGIEDLLPSKQYDNPKHRNAVVDDILSNWEILSKGEKGTVFHALLSTSSIPEAIEYYHIFKKRKKEGIYNLNITALFDPHIDNSGTKVLDKQEALIEIVNDYNKMFDQHFDRDNDPEYKKFKKDIISRLSHKNQYKNMAKDDKNLNERIDILIVVDQMLTGFDSQFVNTLYLDRVLEADAIIQAISRTNRVYDKEEKPFGIFRFYRKPYTMIKNLDDALRLYCEGDTSNVKAKNINETIREIIDIYKNIEKIFQNDGINDFGQLPKEDSDCQKFRKEFRQIKVLINSIKLQGFKWTNKYGELLSKDFNEKTYSILTRRYEDLAHRSPSTSKGTTGVGYNLSTVLSEIAREKIDADYLESHFKKVVPIISSPSTDTIKKEEAINSLKALFPDLTAAQQIYANQIIEDIKDGKLVIDKNKSLREYICEYVEKDINNKIKTEAKTFGIDENLLREIYTTTTSEKDLDEHNRFTKLKDSCDRNKTKEYFEQKTGEKISILKIRGLLDEELKKFILES